MSGRFNEFRELSAKFDTPADKTRCAHPIKKGDRIGYSRKHGVYCRDCWGKWVAENAEADLLEM